MNNPSKANSERWENGVWEVPSRTVWHLGIFTDGMENAEVVWPIKGMEAEIWHALIVDRDDNPEDEGVADTSNANNDSKKRQRGERRTISEALRPETPHSLYNTVAISHLL